MSKLNWCVRTPDCNPELQARVNQAVCQVQPAGQRLLLLCERCRHWKADWCYRCSARYLWKWADSQTKVTQHAAASAPDASRARHHRTGFAKNCAGGMQCPSLLHVLSHHLYTTGALSRSRLKPLSCTAVPSEQATPLSVGTCCVMYLIYSFCCSRRHSL